jgi:hypothetical protein
VLVVVVVDFVVVELLVVVAVDFVVVVDVVVTVNADADSALVLVVVVGTSIVAAVGADASAPALASSVGSFAPPSSDGAHTLVVTCFFARLGWCAGHRFDPCCPRARVPRHLRCA